MSSTFTTPDGSFGARNKVSRLFAMMATRQVAQIRGGAQVLMRQPALVVVTRGRTSGKRYETPVGYLADGDGWLVAAAASGAVRHPAWYRNLAADPDGQSIVVAGEEIPVHAVELHGPDRDAAWARLIEAIPRHASSATKTDREIPVIRFTRR